jgi:hypothetical protein
MAVLRWLPCWRVPAFWAAGLLFCVHSALAQPVSEQQVKAAFLYKFASYVEWPEGVLARADDPLVIGVAGDDALADQLEAMVAGRLVNGHQVQVRRLHGRNDNPGAVHILYAQGERLAPELLAAARGHPVLTVTDSPEAFAQGSMINFVVADERLRFEVAPRRASAEGLRISARMLAVAWRVQGGSAS